MSVAGTVPINILSCIEEEKYLSSMDQEDTSEKTQKDNTQLLH